MEREVNGELPFLDMKVIRTEGKLSSTWYMKPRDTRLIMNFHSESLFKYKKSAVTGFVYRIYNAFSSLKHFHENLTKAKSISKVILRGPLHTCLLLFEMQTDKCTDRMY